MHLTQRSMARVGDCLDFHSPVGDGDDAVREDEARLEAVHVRAADRVVQVELHAAAQTCQTGAAQMCHEVPHGLLLARGGAESVQQPSTVSRAAASDSGDYVGRLPLSSETS